LRLGRCAGRRRFGNVSRSGRGHIDGALSEKSAQQTASEFVGHHDGGGAQYRTILIVQRAHYNVCLCAPAAVRSRLAAAPRLRAPFVDFELTATLMYATIASTLRCTLRLPRPCT
jgi:hypothetical protein